MLLERKDINPDQADTRFGWTPLSWAAENGHKGVVKMIMQWNDVRTAIPDNMDWTS